MFVFIIYLSCLTLIANSDNKIRPNIIFILADDLGFNDVGFHGSSQIPTPNIDALAYSGIILNNYYVAPICTPTRSALMTGKYPIHLGTQHLVLYGAEPRGLNLSEKLMPEYFKDLGYTTRMVGKWHLGSWKLKYTPLFRGFDSHLGFWAGHIDYNDHTAMEKPGWGLDMRNGTSVAYNLHGKYITHIITDEAVKLIKNHDRKSPLFLYLPHAAVHSGNPYNPLSAPDETVAKFTNIEDYNRRRFAGMMTELDKSVGRVVQALCEKSMLENSIIVFSTDNGGPAAGFNLNAASNWPLRGVKNTLWEGGVRAAGLLWSPLLKKTRRISKQMIHVTDWLPTLYKAAGGDVAILNDLDGFNLWESFSEDKPSLRREILHNIDDIQGDSSLMVGNWKIRRGSSYEGQWDFWYGPSGRGGIYDVSSVIFSTAALALNKIGINFKTDDILKLRTESEVVCESKAEVECKPMENDCLFNIEDDPCERNNLARNYTAVLSMLRRKLNEYNSTAVPPANLPIDLRGDPKYWNYVWTNFGDYVPDVAINLI